jgi:hypothetical protein
VCVHFILHVMDSLCQNFHEEVSVSKSLCDPVKFAYVTVI